MNDPFKGAHVQFYEINLLKSNTSPDHTPRTFHTCFKHKFEKKVLMVIATYVYTYVINGQIIYIILLYVDEKFDAARRDVLGVTHLTQGQNRK